MSYEPNNTSPVPSPESASPQARRRAILAGLGKGSVALAALSPLASEASRSHKLFNSVLGKDCYCSVSGFQSPVVAGSTPTTCFTYTPGSFFAKATVNQSYLTFVNTNGTAANGGPYGSANNGTKFTTDLATDLNSFFGLSGVQAITQADAKNLVQAKINIWIPTSQVLLVSFSANGTFSAFHMKNLPTSGLGNDPSVAFNTIFTTSADTRTLAEVLYDGVASSNPASAKCYYLASYLSINNSGLAPSLPLGLDRPYVVVEYTTDSNAALSTNIAAQFFRALASRVGP